MNIGIFGTGVVGQSIGTKLARLDHQVMMGSRSADNEKAAAWIQSAGPGASQGIFGDAASFGEIIFNCTRGSASLDALRAAGADRLKDKILIDVSNPLDFSKGMPPSLFISNTDSLAEQIQQAFPETKVVKSLNTMNCYVMVDPELVPGDHNVFLSGNDAGAKARVAELLQQFGWKQHNIVDLGDITTARGTEMLLPIWLRLWGAMQHSNFNFHVVAGPKPQA